MDGANGAAEVPAQQPPPAEGPAGQAKKRSRWGSKTEPAEAGAAAPAAPGGDDGGEAKRQRKSKVSKWLTWKKLQDSV